jgi:hypothetical protein
MEPCSHRRAAQSETLVTVVTAWSSGFGARARGNTRQVSTYRTFAILCIAMMFVVAALPQAAAAENAVTVFDHLPGSEFDGHAQTYSKRRPLAVRSRA